MQQNNQKIRINDPHQYVKIPLPHSAHMNVMRYVF